MGPKMIETKKTNIKTYDAYVVDMDGTLYYKNAMRIQMILYLICYYLLHPARIRELAIIYLYRKMRDKPELAEQQDIEHLIAGRIAQTLRCTEKQVVQTVTTWIIEKPLHILYSCRDRKLIRWLQEQRKNGKKVYVYSDYPVEAKCKAIEMQTDGIYWPDGIFIKVLKPSPLGLQHIVTVNNLDEKRVLFVGDRMEKDGICAKQVGMECLILKKSWFARWIQYHKI